MCRSWKRIQWEEKFNFSRGTLVQGFYWSLGIKIGSEFKYARNVLSALNVFITTIDDIYDVYGTLEELELLTKLTKR